MFSNFNFLSMGTSIVWAFCLRLFLNRVFLFLSLFNGSKLCFYHTTICLYVTNFYAIIIPCICWLVSFYNQLSQRSVRCPVAWHQNHGYMQIRCLEFKSTGWLHILILLPLDVFLRLQGSICYEIDRLSVQLVQDLDCTTIDPNLAEISFIMQVSWLIVI